MNVSGIDAAGGGGQTSSGYWNKRLTDVVEELPEAEVEELGTSGTDDSGGWFYQEPSSDTNKDTNDNWYYHQS